MSGKSLKFFGPSTTKWRCYKIFRKLNGNDLLMANIFKFTNILHFVLWKCILMWAKSNLPKINSVCKKVWFEINGLSNILFLNFCLFHFPKSQMIWLKPKILLKTFLWLYFINWQNFIVCLRLLCEILGNMCIVIVCKPSCGVINFDINLIFLIKPNFNFFYMTK